MASSVYPDDRDKIGNQIDSKGPVAPQQPQSQLDGTRDLRVADQLTQQTQRIRQQVEEFSYSKRKPATIPNRSSTGQRTAV
jgi:hypothetical protein